MMLYFNGQTLTQDNISKKSLGSVLVINTLKDRTSSLENELSKKDTIINFFLSKQITASKHSISYGNDRNSCSAIQSKCGKIRTRKTPNTDTFYAVLSKDNHVGIQNFPGGREKLF